MKILWLTLDALLPLDSAGRAGVYKRIENICKDNDIYLMYFYSENGELEASKKLEEICKEVHGIKRESNALKLITNYLAYPYTVSTRISQDFIAKMDEILVKEEIDLINIDFPQMGYSLLKSKNRGNIPIVINQHNIEWQRFVEISNSSSISWKRKLFTAIEAKKLKRFEEKLYSKLNVSGFTFVTPEDKKYFIEWINPERTILETIPGGAEAQYTDISQIPNNNNMVFVGVMSNELNPEGAIWFIKNVFPRIKEEVPDAHFTVVGKDPVKDLLELRSEDITITGFVDDLRPYYDNAKMVVIPVLHGGGVKLKLLEAMGYRKIIVSTSVGARGTDFKDKESIYIADSAETFSEYCINILKNTNEYEYIARNAMEVFDAKYTWQGIGLMYESFLKKCVNKS